MVFFSYKAYNTIFPFKNILCWSHASIMYNFHTFRAIKCLMVSKTQHFLTCQRFQNAIFGTLIQSYELFNSSKTILSDIPCNIKPMKYLCMEILRAQNGIQAKNDSIFVWDAILRVCYLKIQTLLLPVNDFILCKQLFSKSLADIMAQHVILFQLQSHEHGTRQIF